MYAEAEALVSQKYGVHCVGIEVTPRPMREQSQVAQEIFLQL
jgi:hypothetical protein